MPLYEFHCEQCEKHSELLVKNRNAKGTHCPHCGSKKLVKKLSVFAAGNGREGEAPACTGKPMACGRCAT